MDPVILTCYLIAAIAHILFRLSIDDCRFLLAGLRFLVALTLERGEDHAIQKDAIVGSIHRDIHTVIDSLDVKPTTERFVCCKSCFKLYRTKNLPPPSNPITEKLLGKPKPQTIPRKKPIPTTKLISEHDGIPRECNHKNTPESEPCGAPLVKLRRVNGAEHEIYVREFFYQDVKEWLGRMLCRPGMEEMFDRDISSTPGAILEDMFNGTVLQEFLGPDGITPFLSRPEGDSEGRYVFSLCVDGFNPFQNKQAGKKASSTAIYMVCLNLPRDIRFLEENMYLVGVIPGPKEPSKAQMNQMLVPLVDDLYVLWKEGAWYSSTPRYPEGRGSRLALVPLVSDLVAARQLSGYAVHSRALHFCHLCDLPRCDINSTDQSSWPERSWEEHRRCAEEWRDAESEEEQDALEKKNGVRWSELMRLPYWNAKLFTIIDTMHTILLGNAETHCREIWGMDDELADGDCSKGVFKPPKRGLPSKITEPENEVMATAHNTLRLASMSDVSQLTTRVLRQLCIEKGVLPERVGDQRKKPKLVAKLREYVSSQPLVFLSISDSRPLIHDSVLTWVGSHTTIYSSSLPVPTKSRPSSQHRRRALRRLSSYSTIRSTQKRHRKGSRASPRMC